MDMDSINKLLQVSDDSSDDENFVVKQSAAGFVGSPSKAKKNPDVAQQMRGFGSDGNLSSEFSNLYNKFANKITTLDSTGSRSSAYSSSGSGMQHTSQGSNTSVFSADSNTSLFSDSASAMQQTQRGSSSSVFSAGSHTSLYSGSGSGIHQSPLGSKSSVWSTDSRSSQHSLTGGAVNKDHSSPGGLKASSSHSFSSFPVKNPQAAQTGQLGDLDANKSSKNVRAPMQPQNTGAVGGSGFDQNQPADLTLHQQQMALQQEYLKQQHILHVKQLAQQLSLLSMEEKQSIVSSLKLSAPANMENQKTARQADRHDSTKAAKKHGKSSTTSLPAFYSGASADEPEADREYLESLQKTFGDRYAENILPYPVLIPSLVKPWSYRSYPVSLYDVCKMDKYMKKKGRHQCGVADVGQFLGSAIEAAAKNIASDSKGKSRSGAMKLKSRESSDVSRARNTFQKSSFESTQSLKVNKLTGQQPEEVTRSLAQQMGAKPPLSSENVQSGSCWDGTAAAPNKPTTEVTQAGEDISLRKLETGVALSSTFWDNIESDNANAFNPNKQGSGN